MLLDDLPQDVFDKVVLRTGLRTKDVVRVMCVSRQMRRQGVLGIVNFKTSRYTYFEQ